MVMIQCCSAIHKQHYYMQYYIHLRALWRICAVTVALCWQGRERHRDEALKRQGDQVSYFFAGLHSHHRLSSAPMSFTWTSCPTFWMPVVFKSQTTAGFCHSFLKFGLNPVAVKKNSDGRLLGRILSHRGHGWTVEAVITRMCLFVSIKLHKRGFKCRLTCQCLCCLRRASMIETGISKRNN